MIVCIINSIISSIFDYFCRRYVYSNCPLLLVIYAFYSNTIYQYGKPHDSYCPIDNLCSERHCFVKPNTFHFLLFRFSIYYPGYNQLIYDLKDQTIFTDIVPDCVKPCK